MLSYLHEGIIKTLIYLACPVKGGKGNTMRRKQITAILLSAIMTVSTCVSAGGISALAAETADEGATQAAVVEEASAEEIAEEPEQAETPAAENEGSHSSVQEKMEENLQEMYKFPENQDPDIPDSGADNGTPGNDTGESSESRQGGQGSIDRRESGRGGPNVR